MTEWLLEMHVIVVTVLSNYFVIVFYTGVHIRSSLAVLLNETKNSRVKKKRHVWAKADLAISCWWQKIVKQSVNLPKKIYEFQFQDITNISGYSFRWVFERDRSTRSSSRQISLNPISPPERRANCLSESGSFFPFASLKMAVANIE